MASSQTRRSRGEHSIYPTKSGRWRGAIMLPDPKTGQPKRRYVSGRSRAEIVAAIKVLERRGYSSNEKVADYLAHWLEGQRPNVRVGTWRAYEQITRLYLVPALGALRLSRLTPLDVERMTAGLIASGRSPRTASHARMVFRRALADAERDGLVTRNVAAQARPPKVEAREMAYLDAAQIRTLLDSLDDQPLGPLVTLAVTTGMRQGELLGLSWKDIDGGRLTVRHQLGRTFAGDGYGWALVSPKSKKSRRTIHLPERAVEALRRQRVQQATVRLAAGKTWQDRDGLVFTDSIGRPLHGPDVNKAFGRLLVAAGLPPMSFHGLRHSAATALLTAGVGLLTVSEMLGHADASLVVRTYGHVVSAQREEAARAMDRALA